MTLTSAQLDSLDQRTTGDALIELQVPGHGWFRTTEARLAINLKRGRRGLIEKALCQYEGMPVAEETEQGYGKPYTKAYFSRFNNRTLAFIADNL